MNTSAAAKQTKARLAPSPDSVKQALTEAVQANANMQTKESGDSVLTGDLVFGVKLEPVRIIPLHAIFVRSWHRSAVGRAIVFVKYEIIEPLFVKDLFGRETKATIVVSLVVPTRQMIPFALSPSGPARCPLLPRMTSRWVGAER